MTESSLFASTFGSFLGSSALLSELPESPCSPEAQEDEEDELPPSDDPLWPRFRAVWAEAGADGRVCTPGEALGSPSCSGRSAALGQREALRKWRAHMRWREAEQMDGVLERPQPLFHFVKRVRRRVRTR